MPAPALVNTLVTLYVNTNPDGGLNQQNVIDHVWMADTDGDVVDNNAGNVANYTTSVQKNGNITWVGAVINIRTRPSDYVLITGITLSPGNGNKINLSNEPSSPANGNCTHVNGRVTGNATVNPFEYRINFKVVHVSDNGGRNEIDLCIDPKIQINS